MSLKLHTQTSFSREIEKIVREKKVSYLDAIFDYVKVCNIELESVPRLINQQLKSCLEKEATDLNLINRGQKKLKILE